MENTIKKGMFNTPIENFQLTKVCSIKPDGQSKESKQVTMTVNYKGVTINDLANATLGQGVIVKWQNGPGRKHFNEWDKNVEIDFRRPGIAPQQDPETGILIKANSMDKSERKAYINDLMAKLRAMDSD